MVLATTKLVKEVGEVLLLWSHHGGGRFGNGGKHGWQRRTRQDWLHWYFRRGRSQEQRLLEGNSQELHISQSSTATWRDRRAGLSASGLTHHRVLQQLIRGQRWLNLRIHENRQETRWRWSSYWVAIQKASTLGLSEQEEIQKGHTLVNLRSSKLYNSGAGEKNLAQHKSLLLLKRQILTTHAQVVPFMEV